MIPQHTSVIKKTCEGCNKFILLHNKLATCSVCEKIVHSKCAKDLMNYDHIKKSWICLACTAQSELRYNPFALLGHDRHDPVELAEADDIVELSKIFEQCKTYGPADFKNLTGSYGDSADFMSGVFNNIDGNASNFDQFVTELSLYKSVFTFIGIAETNVDESCGDLYTIPGYNSE